MKTREETIVLTPEVKKNDWEIAQAIQRASSHIHKYSLRGGGQFIIFEGSVAVDYAKRHSMGKVMSGRYQVVWVDGGIYKNCITMIRRGQYAKMKMKKTKNQMPTIELIATPEKEKDYTCIIYLEKPHSVKLELKDSCWNLPIFGDS